MHRNDLEDFISAYERNTQLRKLIRKARDISVDMQDTYNPFRWYKLKKELAVITEQINKLYTESN